MRPLARPAAAIAAAFVIAGTLATTAAAQVITDPSDPLYDDLEVWETRGLTGPLPALQPYPLPLVRALLQRVERHPQATGAEQRRALWLLGRINDAWPHGAVDTEVRTSTRTPGPYVLTALAPDWQFDVTDWLSLASHVRVSAVRLQDGLLLPENRGNPEDFISDNVNVDVGDTRLDVRHISYGDFAVGTADDDGALFLRAGLLRHRIGPLWRNGIIVGPQAPVAGSFSAMMSREFFSAHIALFELQGEGRAAGKRLHTHALRLHPAPFLDVGVFESVVTGRFEPLYLLPASAYFHAQGLGGFADNSLVGLDGRVSPLPGLDLKGVFYADDFEFNDTIRGVLDTKYKFAAQLGAQWTPTSTFSDVAFLEPLRLVVVDYTAVMPYMYTHLDPGLQSTAGAYNNGGVNIGPALLPNSDRLEGRALVRVTDDPSISLVDLELRGAVIRHGNASAGIIDGADGGLLDPGYLGDVPTFQPPFNDPTGQPHTRFLTQAVIETTWQAGASVRWTLDGGRVVVIDDDVRYDRGWGGVSASLDVTWQWRDNADLVAGRQRGEVFVGSTLGWRY